MKRAGHSFLRQCSGNRRDLRQNVSRLRSIQGLISVINGLPRHSYGRSPASSDFGVTAGLMVREL